MSLKRHLEILVVLLIGSCQSTTNWSPRIYAGSSEKVSIHRDGGKEAIKCVSKDFDDYFCMDKKDMEKLYSKCLDQSFKWYDVTK